jgi:tetratricopeptide (TPR) repeat protein
MERLTTRRFLKCLAVPLIVAQVGCAARGVPVAPAPPPPSVSEEERKACAEFAKREAKSVSTRSVADAAGEGFAVGLLSGLYFLNPGLGLFMAPAFAIGGAIDQSLKNSSMRKRAYASAEDTCLKPVVLAETLGSEHADVGSALRSLANGYANQKDYVTAESLYERALGIQERALGPESAEVATTLEAYAAVLQSTHREERATDLLARAGAIRASAEPHPDPAPEPAAETPDGTPGDRIEPAIASAPASPAADE